MIECENNVQMFKDLTNGIIGFNDDEIKDIVISAGDVRYRHLNSEAYQQEVLQSRMPKLKASKGSVFT